MTAIATGLAGCVTGCGFGGCAFLFLVVVEGFFFAGLLVEVQLDFVIEVGFLEHFAQVAGAKRSGERFLFVFVEVLHFGLAMAGMGDSVELLAIDDLFFNESSAGSVRGNCRREDGSGGDFPLWRRLFVLLLAEAKEAEIVRRQGIDVVRGRGIGIVAVGIRLGFKRSNGCFGIGGLDFNEFFIVSA